MFDPSSSHAKTKHHPIPDRALLSTAFITSACVLIIELTGTRILAPYFGSGVYTWSALIAVTLVALALGYVYGERLADRLPRTDILYNLCLAAGLWTLSTPILASPLLSPLVDITDIRIKLLISSCILYYPNMFLLGAVVPFVIRLIARQDETAGSASGRVFAVSTVGGLFGALATGFILIPNFGVQAIFTFCGTLLIFLAILGNFRPKFIGYKLVLISIVVSILLLTGKNIDSTSSIEMRANFYGQLQLISRHGEKSL
jgi:predicted membrane-bound spermidine synthase